MPTYEYACKSCGEHLEIVQSFKDEPLTTCPACGGALRKVFGSIGISFKGSGFYKTDSRSAAASSSSTGKSDSTGKAEPAKSDAAASGESTSGSKSDSPASAGSSGSDSSKSPKSPGSSSTADAAAS